MDPLISRLHSLEPMQVQFEPQCSRALLNKCIIINGTINIIIIVLNINITVIVIIIIINNTSISIKRSDWPPQTKNTNQQSNIDPQMLCTQPPLNWKANLNLFIGSETRDDLVVGLAHSSHVKGLSSDLPLPTLVTYPPTHTAGWVMWWCIKMQNQH